MLILKIWLVEESIRIQLIKLLKIHLSLHVPGSDSSALTTRKDGLPSLTLGMKDHFKPEGKPAPPRPRRPNRVDYMCHGN